MELKRARSTGLFFVAPAKINAFVSDHELYQPFIIYTCRISFLINSFNFFQTVQQ